MPLETKLAEAFFALNGDYWITLGVWPFSTRLNFGYFGAVGWYLSLFILTWGILRLTLVRRLRGKPTA